LLELSSYDNKGVQFSSKDVLFLHVLLSTWSASLVSG